MFDRDPSPAPAQVVPGNIYDGSEGINFQMIPYTVTEVGSEQTVGNLGTVISLQSVVPNDLVGFSLCSTMTDLSSQQLSGGAAVSAPGISEEDLLDTIAATIDPGSLTPIIKEELKCTIQSRRVAEGKEKLQVRFTIPEKVELSDEEKEKVVKRREQNRVAAQKFRDKQKALGSKLSKKIQGLESRNTLLTTEIKQLKAERDELKRRVREHMTFCPYMQMGT